MQNDHSNNNPSYKGTENQAPSVIKGGYQVITPNPPPNPAPAGTWGTATPSGASISQSSFNNTSQPLASKK